MRGYDIQGGPSEPASARQAAARPRLSIKARIGHSDSVIAWRWVSRRNRGHDAAIVEADPDLYAPQGDRRDALHQMRGSDEAAPCRAAQSAVRFADLPMRQMWFCGKLPAANVDCRRLRTRPEGGVDTTDLRLARGNYAGRRFGEFPPPRPVMQSGTPQPRRARLSNAETGLRTASLWSPQDTLNTP